MRNALISLLMGAVMTLVLAVGACLVLMLTTPEAGVRKEGLFGAVFFGSTEAADGSIGMSLGINSLPALAVLWLVCSAVVFAVSLVVARLLRYRKSLLARPQSS